MRKNLFISLLALFTISFFVTGCVGNSMLDNRKSSKKARVIFEVPKSVELKSVTNALYESISVRVNNIEEEEGLEPEDLPLQPEKPKKSNATEGMRFLLQGSPSYEVMKLDTSNAYYTVSGRHTTLMQSNSVEEYYKGAIYPYQKGYKVYIYLFYKEGSKGLSGAIAGAVSKAIIGKDTILFTMSKVRNKFKELIPQAKIKSQSPRTLKNIK